MKILFIIPWFIGMLILTVVYLPIWVMWAIQYGAFTADRMVHTKSLTKPWSWWNKLMV